MTTPDYTAFDAALLAHIKAGRNTAMVLEHQSDLGKLAKPHQGSTPETPVFRVIDRRLQALRKADRITFSGKAGWQIVEGKA